MPVKRKKITCIGGGTGTSMVLSGLKKYPVDLTAVVTMFDNAGSSGQLRKELGVLPFGDLRQCLVALAKTNALLDFFNYRFGRGALKGHNLGNLLITAASQTGQNLEEGIEKVSRLLKIKGRVLPVTLENTNIVARLKDGREIRGEDDIVRCPDLAKIGLAGLYLDPPVKANPRALQSIKEADLIVIGPGKFYTSIISNFLVKEIPQAIRQSRAGKIFICNLMTQSGNTDHFSVSDFVAVLEQYLGKKTIDRIIFNTGQLSKDQLKENRRVFPGAWPIGYQASYLNKKNFIGADLLNRKIKKASPADCLVRGVNRRTMVLHDSEKLAKIILSLINND